MIILDQSFVLSKIDQSQVSFTRKHASIFASFRQSFCKFPRSSKFTIIPFILNLIGTVFQELSALASIFGFSFVPPEPSQDQSLEHCDVNVSDFGVFRQSRWLIETILV